MEASPITFLQRYVVHALNNSYYCDTVDQRPSFPGALRGAIHFELDVVGSLLQRLDISGRRPKRGDSL